MLKIINIELYKIFKKLRTYISFGTIFFLVGVILIAMLVEGDGFISFATRRLEDSFSFVGNFLNGYLIGYTVLNFLIIHVPFLIVLVAGDLLAGEATAGTYRLLLSRPVSRFTLVTGKFLAGLIFTFSLVAFLGLMSLGLGLIIFGHGELIVFQSDHLVILAANDVLWRFAYAYLFAVLSMSVITSLAFFFSSLVENAIGPIVTTMAVVIAFLILSQIDFGFLHYIKPYLFTNYFREWSALFDSQVNFAEFINACLILSLHTVGFYALTVFIFRKRDILT